MTSVQNAKRLGLGTVQFGADYGISNARGRLSENEVRGILEYAGQCGITLLDTASLYGDSEAVLGRSLPAERGFRIVSKTPAAGNAVVDEAFCLEVEKALYRSLELLQQPSLYGLLIHDVKDLLKPGGERLLSTLQSFHSKGLVQKIGVSVYDAAQIDAVLEMFTPHIIQLPLSVADQRLRVSGHLKKLCACGVEIHARSLFLQGALLMDPQTLPQHFDPVRQHFTDFGLAAERAGLTRLQACLQFAFSLPEISTALVGVTSQEELAEIVSACGQSEELAFDADAFALNDERYTNPLHWPWTNA